MYGKRKKRFFFLIKTPSRSIPQMSLRCTFVVPPPSQVPFPKYLSSLLSLPNEAHSANSAFYKTQSARGYLTSVIL